MNRIFLTAFTLWMNILLMLGVNEGFSYLGIEFNMLYQRQTSKPVDVSQFEVIYQNPELPTGCEIVAAAMLTNYYGFDIDKVTLCDVYLPTISSTGTYRGKDGKRYGNDMENFFIGDPKGRGIICGVGAIKTALDSYFSDIGSRLAAHDLTGSSPDTLYELVSTGTPVMVWVTIGMRDRGKVSGWYRSDGVFMDWSRNDHGAVLIGSDGSSVTIADPIKGVFTCKKENFESIFTERGSKCLIIQ